MTLLERTGVLAVALVLVAVPGLAFAKEVQVKMLNKGAAGFMVFEPAFVKLAPGDTVRFVSTNPSHYAETFPTMLPAGGQAFRTPLNKDAVVKFTAPGLYGYNCPPHLGMGMVGLIQVGAASNKSAVVAATAKLPGLAKARMNAAVAGAR